MSYYGLVDAKIRATDKDLPVQQRTGLVLLDVWNVIEAFRENGLSNTTADIDMTISKAKLEALLTSMYGALAKRLPPPNSYSNSNGHQGAGTTTKDLQAMASWLFNWLFNALKPAGSSNIKVSQTYYMHQKFNEQADHNYLSIKKNLLVLPFLYQS